MPVLYQQGAPAFQFSERAHIDAADTVDCSGIPEHARLDNGDAPHGLIGRDGAVLVRPDGHIAWRREAGTVTDAATALRAAVAVATGRRARAEGTVEAPALVA